MSVALTDSADTVAPGGSVTATVRVTATQAVAHHTVVRLSATNATVTLNASGSLGDVGSGGRSVTATVKISPQAGTSTVTLTGVVTADRVGSRSVTRKINVTPGGAAANNANVFNPNIPFTNGTSAPPGTAPQVALPLIAPDPAVAPEPSKVVTTLGLRSSRSPLGMAVPANRMIAALQGVWSMTLLGGSMLSLVRLRIWRYRQYAATGEHPTRRIRRRVRRIQRIRSQHLRQSRSRIA